MRQVVLDTETTGFEVSKGHRMVEVGCVELCERRRTGRTFHRYFNPQRLMDEGARNVTGLDDEFLAAQPLFETAATELLEFIRGSELIIHNAEFDLGFLNAEFARCDGEFAGVRNLSSVLDTLLLARERYPGQRNSLDALCKRLGVDNSHRNQHGALLDAELLVDVYLSMTAGQGSLGFDANSSDSASGKTANTVRRKRPPVLQVLRANAEELAAHEARLAALRKSGKCLWPQLLDLN